MSLVSHPSCHLAQTALTDVMTPHCMLQHRRGSPNISSSDDEDSIADQETDQQSDDDSREHTPTTTDSSITIDIADGETVITPMNGRRIWWWIKVMASARIAATTREGNLRDFEDELKS
jgi:hypothetical protein